MNREEFERWFEKRPKPLLSFLSGLMAVLVIGRLHTYLWVRARKWLKR